MVQVLSDKDMSDVIRAARLTYIPRLDSDLEYKSIRDDGSLGN